MINLKKHLSLLGHKVKDCVTGREGVVVSVSFDLFGCIQAIVNPGLDKEGKQIDQCWFDVNRLVITDPAPVMAQPEFDWTPEKISSGEKGPADKPSNPRF